MEKKSKILVVDDEKRNLRLMDALLTPLDYEVILANDGEEAIKKVKETPPDVVLLDVMMDGLDGFEVCRRLKNNPKTAPIPILLVTALEERTDRITGIEAGANDFLSKPIDPPDLLLRIRNAAYTKSLYDQQEKNYKKLKELEKLRDNLTDMIVHDMRTPLTGIKSYLRLLQIKSQINLGNKESQYVTKALDSTSTLIEMVNSLLDVSKFEEGKMKLDLILCDFRQLIKNAINMLGISKDKLNICFEPPKEPVYVSCDSNLIRRVIVNILGNSVKFTPIGGNVVISLKIEDKFVRVAVTDTGYGIPHEYHEKIFEKFGQVEIRGKRQKYSTGLGLTFCKLAIEAHNGKIGVNSKQRHGSTFWFVLPI